MNRIEEAARIANDELSKIVLSDQFKEAAIGEELTFAINVPVDNEAYRARYVVEKRSNTNFVILQHDPLFKI